MPSKTNCPRCNPKDASGGMALASHQRRARERLEVAAPELLKAAKELVANSGHLSPFGGDVSVLAVRRAGKYMGAFDDLRAAIAKAEG